MLNNKNNKKGQIKMSNVVASFLIFGIFIGLFLIIYNGLEEGYSVVPTDTREGATIVERMDQLDLPKQINTTVGSLYKITNPTGVIDFIGSLTLTGIGILKIATSIIAFPPQIFAIITDFYPVPGLIPGALITLFIIYVGFMILNEYSKRNN